MAETDRDRLAYRVDVLNSIPRDAARRLIADGAAVEDLLALVDEIHRQKDAWAAVSVDRDRKVRAASKRALDCTEHGHLIAALEKQVGEFDRLFHTADHARVIAIQGISRIKEHLAEAETPDVAATLAYIARIQKAHMAAWQPKVKDQAEQAKPVRPARRAADVPSVQAEGQEDLLDLMSAA